jgi:hypothetical protein
MGPDDPVGSSRSDRRNRNMIIVGGEIKAAPIHRTTRVTPGGVWSSIADL